jgi:hypothetical protein
MLRTLLLILAVTTLSACASSYTPEPTYYERNSPGRAGYEDIPVDPTTYRVVYHGPAFLELVDRYAFYRAAELTLEKGFDYFVVLQNGLDDRGRQAWNIIRMFKGTPSESDLATFDAREVTKEMAPFIQHGEEGANK